MTKSDSFVKLASVVGEVKTAGFGDLLGDFGSKIGSFFGKMFGKDPEAVTTGLKEEANTAKVGDAVKNTEEAASVAKDSSIPKPPAMPKQKSFFRRYLPAFGAGALVGAGTSAIVHKARQKQQPY